MKFQAALFVLAVAVGLPDGARSCIMIEPAGTTNAQRLATAEAAVDRAAAVVDARVQRQAKNGQPGVIVVERVLKGPRQATFEIEPGPSCDYSLGKPGSRGRFVLFGGPQRYRLPMFGPATDWVDLVLEDRWPTGRPKLEGVFSSFVFNPESGDGRGMEIEVHGGVYPTVVFTRCDGECHGGAVWPATIRGGSWLEFAPRLEWIDRQGVPRSRSTRYQGRLEGDKLMLTNSDDPSFKEVLVHVAKPHPGQTARLGGGK